MGYKGQGPLLGVLVLVAHLLEELDQLAVILEPAAEGPFRLHGNPGSADDWKSLVGAVGAVGLRDYKWHRMARIWRTPVLGEIFQVTTTRGAFRSTLNRSEPRGLPRPFVERMFDHYDRRTRRAVLKLYRATDEPGVPNPQLVAALAAADPPTLVIWGGGDPYLPSSYAERQREFLPRAEVHVLPHSGHWPFADDPAEVERLLLLDFLTRTAP